MHCHTRLPEGQFVPLFTKEMGSCGPQVLVFKDQGAGRTREEARVSEECEKLRRTALAVKATRHLALRKTITKKQTMKQHHKIQPHSLLSSSSHTCYVLLPGVIYCFSNALEYGISLYLGMELSTGTQVAFQSTLKKSLTRIAK